ncbi:hypothetical protein AC1031_004170 [Aphanomyces cochlioides]|nr:hypothetical protein AC1031_004170 [Aphanomyces cochlioides]
MAISMTTVPCLLATAAGQLEIVGGKEAAAGKHLYTTSLRLTLGGTTYCGGSLIAPNVILTAAHCTVELNGALKYAVIGTHYNGGTQYGETIAIKQQIVHPKYNRNTNSNDFAIYILASNAKTAPVTVSFDTVAASVPVVVRGWGATSQGGSSPNVLLELTVNSLSNTQCASYLSGYTVAQGIKPGVYSRISAAKDFISPYLPKRVAAFEVDVVEDNNSTDVSADVEPTLV